MILTLYCRNQIQIIFCMEEIKSRPADLSPHHVLLCYPFAYWVILHALFAFAVVFFSKSAFSKNSFRNTIRVSTSLDPGQARRLVGPDLGPNCLQRLSADDISRQIVRCLSETMQFHKMHVEHAEIRSVCLSIKST